jgi:hypothetical protein
VLSDPDGTGNSPTGTTEINNKVDLNGDNAEGYTFSAPERSLGDYNASLGGTNSFDAFFTQAILQSKDNWRPTYTAPAVNDYFRAGFNMTLLGVDGSGGATATAINRPRLRLR